MAVQWDSEHLSFMPLDHSWTSKGIFAKCNNCVSAKIITKNEKAEATAVTPFLGGYTLYTTRTNKSECLF